MAQQGGIQPLSWEQRSHGQLQEIVQRGIAGGDDFVAAAREMERRSREKLRADELEEADAALARRKYRLVTLAGVAAAAFVLVMIGMLFSAT